MPLPETPDLPIDRHAPPAADPTSVSPLHGQRVVVVGGTSGMGLGAVRATVAAGARVVVAGRRPQAARDAIEAGNGRIEHAVVDVTDEGAIRALFDRLGALDHLFVTATPPVGSNGAFWSRMSPRRRPSCTASSSGAGPAPATPPHGCRQVVRSPF